MVLEWMEEKNQTRRTRAGMMYVDIHIVYPRYCEEVMVEGGLRLQVMMIWPRPGWARRDDRKRGDDESMSMELC